MNEQMSTSDAYNTLRRIHTIVTSALAARLWKDEWSYDYQLGAIVFLLERMQKEVEFLQAKRLRPAF